MWRRDTQGGMLSERCSSKPWGLVREGAPVNSDGPTHEGRLVTDADLIRRLRRIEGQVRGVQRMIEEGRGCPEVLVQLAAVREAVNKVGVLMMALHMERCFREDRSDTPEDWVSRAKEAVEMFLKFS